MTKLQLRCGKEREENKTVLSHTISLVRTPGIITLGLSVLSRINTCGSAIGLVVPHSKSSQGISPEEGRLIIIFGLIMVKLVTSY